MNCAVLVVDDDATMRETMRTILKIECDVVTAESAEVALDQLERKTFDVVLSDIQMGGMNGLELLTIIRRRWPSTNVIMVSVITEVSIAVEAMRLGAYFYTTKDFDWKPLNDLVKLAAERRPSDDGGGGEALRQENLKLRRECEELKNQLRKPTKIEDRLPTRSESPLIRQAG